MHTRRTLILSSAALVATPAFASIPSPDMPHATAEPGNPPYLDFGDGLKVPLSKDIFLTLWEDPRFWITYGYGRAEYGLRANGKAVKFALGAMKLLLLTLAFAPERLNHVNDCGWRLKDAKARNYVKGDVDLPGKPFFPSNDSSLGFGSTDTNVLSGPSSIGGTTLAAPGAASSSVSGGYGVSTTGGFAKVDAFSAYLVWKKDADLDYIRSHAQLL